MLEVMAYVRIIRRLEGYLETIPLSVASPGRALCRAAVALLQTTGLSRSEAWGTVNRWLMEHKPKRGHGFMQGRYETHLAQLLYRLVDEANESSKPAPEHLKTAAVNLKLVAATLLLASGEAETETEALRQLELKAQTISVQTGPPWHKASRERGEFREIMETTTNPRRTRVVFRVWPNGDVIALFPDEPADNEGHCMSYEHFGQHGAADYRHVSSQTRPATTEEAAELKAELENIGYKLAPSKEAFAANPRFHKGADPYGRSSYSIPDFAVAGASDTGTYSDSPAPRRLVGDELDRLRAVLKEHGIASRLVYTLSGNMCMAKRWVLVSKADFQRAEEIARQWLTEHEADTDWIHHARG